MARATWSVSADEARAEGADLIVTGRNPERLQRAELARARCSFGIKF